MLQVLASVTFLLGVPQLAFAYVDAETGSLLYQILIGSGLSLAAVWRIFVGWMRRSPRVARTTKSS